MKFQCPKCGSFYYDRPAVMCGKCNEPAYNFLIIRIANGISTDPEDWVLTNGLSRLWRIE
jgi:hypothetical protein